MVGFVTGFDCWGVGSDSQGLTQRVKVLAERYEKPLPEVMDRVQALESKVAAHLEKMGFSL